MTFRILFPLGRHGPVKAKVGGIDIPGSFQRGDEFPGKLLPVGFGQGAAAIAHGKPGGGDGAPERALHVVERVTSVEPNHTEALEMMYEQKLSCLPVVDEGKLIGMVTERDVMSIARQLLEERLAGGDGE
mgnify:CR=1 FL=1